MTKKLPRESAFAKRVWKELDKIPNSYFSTIQQKAIRGLPDVIGCINGRFVALELKRSKAEASKKSGRIVLQKYIMEKITGSGGTGYFVEPLTLDIVIAKLMEISRNDQI